MEPKELARALRDGTLIQAAAELERERGAALGGGDTRASAAAANDLGVVYYLLAQTGPAREMLESSRDDFVRLNDAIGQARALGNLARLEEKSHNRRAALALYQQAADLFHDSKAHGDEFATLRSLSQLYLKMGGWIQALATYDRGLTIKPHGTILDVILHWLYQIPLRMLGLSPA
jgi:tetratricopeptide (TPR) repeat protein